MSFELPKKTEPSPGKIYDKLIKPKDPTLQQPPGPGLSEEEVKFIEGARAKQKQVMAECEAYDIGRTDQEIVIGKLIGFIDRFVEARGK